MAETLNPIVLNDQLNRLSPRIREAVELLRKGLRNKDIAASMGLKEKTVKFYLISAFQVLDVSSRSQLIVKYGATGIIDDGPAPGSTEMILARLRGE